MGGVNQNQYIDNVEVPGGIQRVVSVNRTLADTGVYYNTNIGMNDLFPERQYLAIPANNIHISFHNQNGPADIAGIAQLRCGAFDDKVLINVQRLAAADGYFDINLVPGVAAPIRGNINRFAGLGADPALTIINNFFNVVVNHIRTVDRIIASYNYLQQLGHYLELPAPANPPINHPQLQFIGFNRVGDYTHYLYRALPAYARPAGFMQFTFPEFPGAPPLYRGLFSRVRNHPQQDFVYYYDINSNYMLPVIQYRFPIPQFNNVFIPNPAFVPAPAPVPMVVEPQEYYPGQAVPMEVEPVEPVEPVEYYPGQAMNEIGGNINKYENKAIKYQNKLKYLLN